MRLDQALPHARETEKWRDRDLEARIDAALAGKGE